MTPAAIIASAAREGVMLALSPAGAIKATGDDTAVKRWLPTIRAHKAGIIAHLAPVDGDATVTVAALPAADTTIRAWLDSIGEDDPATVAGVLARCAADPLARAYFHQRAADAGIAAPPAPRCADCAHLATPGVGNRYCGAGRDDLPPAYGPGHPLCRIPGDGAAGCARFHPLNA